MQLLFGFGGEVFRIGGEYARAIVEDHDASLSGIDVAEIVPHIKLGDVADGSGELNAGGAATDDNKVERRMPALLLHLALGQLESEKDATADLGGVLDGLKAGGERSPLVLAEIGMCRSGGDDEVVVGEMRARGELDATDWTSMEVTSSMRTSVFGWWRRMVRIGCAISAGDRTARAT